MPDLRELDSFEAICEALEALTALYASTLRRAALDHAVENLRTSGRRQTSNRLTAELRTAEERFTEWVLELLAAEEQPILPRYVFNERKLRLLARATALALRPHVVPHVVKK